MNPAAIAAAALGDLPNAQVASTPGGIEAQEKAGQLSLVASTDMPIDMTPSKQAFEAMGFVFGEREAPDSIFFPARLPQGWMRRACEQDMWSDIVDGQGRVRVSVFYKAAFYDRSASSRLVRRYATSLEYIDDRRTAVIVTDGGKTIHRIALPDEPENRDRAYMEVCKDIHEQAGRWLDEHRPDWRNPVAYRNEP